VKAKREKAGRRQEEGRLTAVVVKRVKEGRVGQRDGEGKDKSLAGSTGQADTSKGCATLSWTLAEEGGLVVERGWLV